MCERACCAFIKSLESNEGSANLGWLLMPYGDNEVFWSLQIIDREARLAPEEEAAASREAVLAAEAAQLEKREQELDALHQMLAQKVSRLLVAGHRQFQTFHCIGSLAASAYPAKHSAKQGHCTLALCMHCLITGR